MLNADLFVKKEKLNVRQHRVGMFFGQKDGFIVERKAPLQEIPGICEVAFHMGEPKRKPTA